MSIDDFMENNNSIENIDRLYVFISDLILKHYQEEDIIKSISKEYPKLNKKEIKKVYNKFFVNDEILKSLHTYQCIFRKALLINDIKSMIKCRENMDKLQGLLIENTNNLDNNWTVTVTEVSKNESSGSTITS